MTNKMRMINHLNGVQVNMDRMQMDGEESLFAGPEKEEELYEEKLVDEMLIKVNLGERINKHNIFRLFIPNSPNMPKTMGGLSPNLSIANSINNYYPDDLYFYGIENFPNIKKVTFLLYNYSHVYHLPGHLEDQKDDCEGIWRVSPEVLPLVALLEYSDQMKLEVEIELATQKRRFYQFNAYYVKAKSPISSAFHEIPTYDKDKKIQIIGKIWRIVNKAEKDLV